MHNWVDSEWYLIGCRSAPRELFDQACHCSCFSASIADALLLLGPPAPGQSEPRSFFSLTYIISVVTANQQQEFIINLFSSLLSSLSMNWGLRGRHAVRGIFRGRNKLTLFIICSSLYSFRGSRGRMLALQRLSPQTSAACWSFYQCCILSSASQPFIEFLGLSPEIGTHDVPCPQVSC